MCVVDAQNSHSSVLILGETGDNCNSFWKIECNFFFDSYRNIKTAQLERLISLLEIALGLKYVKHVVLSLQ